MHAALSQGESLAVSPEIPMVWTSRDKGLSGTARPGGSPAGRLVCEIHAQMHPSDFLRLFGEWRACIPSLMRRSLSESQVLNYLPNPTFLAIASTSYHGTDVLCLPWFFSTSSDHFPSLYLPIAYSSFPIPLHARQIMLPYAHAFAVCTMERRLARDFP